MPPEVHLQPEPQTLRSLLVQAASCLRQQPERARADAELLLRHVLQRDKAWIVAHGLTPLPAAEAERIHRLLQPLLLRRAAGEPVQYILGETEFFGLNFAVSPAVLIPRPETELLVEQVLAVARTLASPRILDIGTGSGAIAIALAAALPQAHLVAVDLSPAALDLAHRNAHRHGLADRIHFLESDLFSALSGQRFDVVVSNPPYVPLQDASTLAVEVRDHEPALALFAGDDGLAVYRRLIPATRRHLAPGGLLALEFGFGQQQPIAELLAASGFHGIETLPDYQQIPRIALAVQPNP